MDPYVGWDECGTGGTRVLTGRRLSSDKKQMHEASSELPVVDRSTLLALLKCALHIRTIIR